MTMNFILKVKGFIPQNSLSSVRLKLLLVLVSLCSCLGKTPEVKKNLVQENVYKWRSKQIQGIGTLNELYKDSLLIQKHFRIGDSRDSFMLFNYLNNVWYNIERNNDKLDSSVVLYIGAKKDSKSQAYPVMILKPIVENETYNLKVLRDDSTIFEFQNCMEPLNWMLVEYIRNPESNKGTYSAEFEMFSNGQFTRKFKRVLWSEKSREIQYP